MVDDRVAHAVGQLAIQDGRIGWNVKISLRPLVLEGFSESWNALDQYGDGNSGEKALWVHATRIEHHAGVWKV